MRNNGIARHESRYNPTSGKPWKRTAPDFRLFIKMMAWHDRSWRPTLCFFLLVRSASRCIRRGGRFLCYRGLFCFGAGPRRGYRQIKSDRNLIYLMFDIYIYNIYIGSLIFQRRSFSRKWKRARREFGNVCFLFGSNDYGIPRFFAESLITDSCKCHARCLLRCDAKVAGQRKIRGVTI